MHRDRKKVGFGSRWESIYSLLKPSELRGCKIGNVVGLLKKEKP
jgi:hypothetical protein